jgi:hypothetical protein
MNLLEFLRKPGHVAKAIGKEAEHIGIIAGEVALEAAPVVVPEAAPVASAILHLLPVMHVTVPQSAPVAKVMAGFFHTSIEGNSMNPLESFAITMILGMLQTTVKNPAHKAALETQLVGLADMIYAAYGMVSPVAPAPVAAHEHVTGQ